MLPNDNIVGATGKQHKPKVFNSNLWNVKSLNLWERNLNLRQDQHVRGGDPVVYHRNYNQRSLTLSSYRGPDVSLVYVVLR